MDDDRREQPEDAGQQPHTPGDDPAGTGQPREPETQGSERDPVADDAAAAHAQGEQQQGGAPLGGDESTEERLEADTAVEEDTLKSLDPDDAPA